MRPITDLSEVRPSNVLHHSAFGFARVRAIEADQVVLQWQEADENLPQRVGGDSLLRVYTLCAPGGFFDRAINNPDDLRELLQVDPTGAIFLLLSDIERPQRREDIKDWVTGRGLVSEDTFDRWWERLQPVIEADDRFAMDQGAIGLHPDNGGDPRERLANPLVPPARRLELALAHRADLGDVAFLEQALIAWKTGGSRVRDLAMHAVADFPPDAVLKGLLGPGAESVEAIIHAIRNAGWTPDDVSPEVRHRLLDRVVDASMGDGDIEPEGRLAASLWRWGASGTLEALSRLAGARRGQDLLASAFGALPVRRAEALAVSLLQSTLATENDPVAATWLSGWLLDSDESPTELIARVEASHPPVAARLVREREEREDAEHTMDSEEGPLTAEITREVFSSPVSLAELPPRMERAFLPLGLSLARALARHHAAGRIVSPTRDTVRLHPDGSVEINPTGDPRESPRAPGEPASKQADVYAAAVLLLESLIGRTWPRNLSGDRAIPFLRHIAPDLPPSALAPLAVALDPLPPGRPADAVSWLGRWQAAVRAEEARATSEHDPRLRLKAGFDTHVGRMKILHTQTNQDALYVSIKGPMALLVVCDGISTANTGSGDLAAAISTQVIASLWEQWLPRLVNHRPEDAKEFLDRAMRMANQAVCEASLRLAGGRLEGRVPMGTTTVIAVAQGNHVSLGWLGDSRAYVVGQYGASQLTADANQAGERMVDWHRGLAPGFDATGFALVRYIGHFDELGHPEPLPALHGALTLLPDERLLLCSDGITDYIADSQAEVASVIGAQSLLGDCDEVARALVELANRGGGGDNATAIVVSPA